MEGIYKSLLVASLWALPPIVHKHIFNKHEINPLSLLVISSVFYIIVSIPIAIYNKNDALAELNKLEWSDVGLVAFSAAFAGVFANILYYRIIKYHESYVTTAIMYSSPLFVFVFSLLYLQERTSPYSIVGVLLIMSGIFALAYHEKYT